MNRRFRERESTWIKCWSGLERVKGIEPSFQKFPRRKAIFPRKTRLREITIDYELFLPFIRTRRWGDFKPFWGA
jgi:hypothetical protein